MKNPKRIAEIRGFPPPCEYATAQKKNETKAKIIDEICNHPNAKKGKLCPFPVIDHDYDQFRRHYGACPFYKNPEITTIVETTEKIVTFHCLESGKWKTEDGRYTIQKLSKRSPEGPKWYILTDKHVQPTKELFDTLKQAKEWVVDQYEVFDKLRQK